MDIRSISPNELYYLIIQNNSRQVVQNLQQSGINVKQDASDADLLQIILSLSNSLDRIEYIELVSRILNVEILEDGANAEKIVLLLDNNVGSLAVENYLANSPHDLSIVKDSEYSQCKKLSYIGLISIVIFALAFLALVFRPNNQ